MGNITIKGGWWEQWVRAFIETQARAAKSRLHTCLFPANRKRKKKRKNRINSMAKRNESETTESESEAEEKKMNTEWNRYKPQRHANVHDVISIDA